MDPFLEKGRLSTFGNKVLHLVEFVYAAHFKSLRVMKDKVWVALEDHLVCDVVKSALEMCQLHAPRTTDSEFMVALVLTPADSWIRARSS